jgi:hypothetical protein
VRPADERICVMKIQRHPASFAVIPATTDGLAAN